MALTPPALVASAPRPPLSFGLFSVVAPRTGSQDRWEGGGVRLEEFGCAPEDGFTLGSFNCTPGENEPKVEGLPKVFGSNTTFTDTEPFYIYQSEVCSPIGNDLERSQEVASARLSMFEELLVERRLSVLLSGVTTKSNPLTVNSTRAELLTEIGTLEHTAASLYGTQGVIHLSRDVAYVALGYGVLEARQGRLYTLLGSSVVAGSGYDLDEAVWTPQMVAYASDIFTSSNRQGDLLDRAENNLYAVAERAWLVTFDLSCISPDDEEEEEEDENPDPDPDPEP